jgi:hypothetical protein
MASLGPLGVGGGWGTGVGSGGGAGAAAGCGLCSTSVPCTGPRQVVPVYGRFSVLPLSSMLPFAVTLNGQFGMPGMLPAPSIVTATLLPFNWPLTDAETVRPLPHTAVNVPVIDVAVCDPIWYWKLPHVLADGRFAETDDVQMPTIDGEVEDVGVGVPAGAVVPLLAADDGASTLDLCSNPHPATPTAAKAAASKRSDL